MKAKYIIELTLLFIIIPMSLALNISPMFKGSVLFMGIGYVLFISINNNLFTKKHLIGKVSNNFPKLMWIMILIYLPLSTIIAWYTIPNTLFEIVLQKPFLWAGVMVFYSCVSVYIQEYLYRTFFFHRYESIFSKNVLLFINAIVFSLAHAMFHNYYVLLLTFLGGLVFAFTFFKTKSLLIVSIEHAIYGCWLFTLGIGKDLAFPEA